MAVYTDVSEAQAAMLMSTLGLGQLTGMSGCSGGIENTNYFVNTDHGEYVLTLVERLTFAQLPFYLRLMKHLALRGIPVPNPAANAFGDVLHTLQGKPAAVVNRLRGASELAPSAAHCTAVGGMLARMHLAARDFDMRQNNLRALPWWNATVPAVLPFLNAQQAILMRSELAYQNHVTTGALYAALPRGPIHGDLFRDNVMFESPTGLSPANAPALTGFFDFYFAGCDTWLYDIAVCLNDWCVDLKSGASDGARMRHFLAAYSQVRPFSAAERGSLVAMLRGAALRFWLSRLWDLHLPREASMLTAHDPGHFERVLRQRVNSLTEHAEGALA